MGGIPVVCGARELRLQLRGARANQCRPIWAQSSKSSVSVTPAPPQPYRDRRAAGEGRAEKATVPVNAPRKKTLSVSVIRYIIYAYRSGDIQIIFMNQEEPP